MRYIQLRLTDEQHALLAERADRAKRTVPGHIMALLEESDEALALPPKRRVAPSRRFLQRVRLTRPVSVWRGEALYPLT